MKSSVAVELVAVAGVRVGNGIPTLMHMRCTMHLQNAPRAALPAFRIVTCGSGSGGLAYGSAWVGLACGSHALLGNQFTAFSTFS